MAVVGAGDGSHPRDFDLRCAGPAISRPQRCWHGVGRPSTTAVGHPASRSSAAWSALAISPTSAFRASRNPSERCPTEPSLVALRSLNTSTCLCYSGPYEPPFVHGVDAALLGSAGTTLVAAVLALLYLPKTNTSMNTEPAGTTSRLRLPESATWRRARRSAVISGARRKVRGSQAISTYSRCPRRRGIENRRRERNRARQQRPMKGPRDSGLSDESSRSWQSHGYRRH